MKIMHIQMAGPFSENYSYKENIISKYHFQVGNEVVFLGTCYSLSKGD